jgi:hypothetical protein
MDVSVARVFVVEIKYKEQKKKSRRGHGRVCCKCKINGKMQDNREKDKDE